MSPVEQVIHRVPRDRRRGVVGILRDGPAMLLVRRAQTVSRGGCWCFPGGHIEPGENARHAVVRELLEELGVDVLPVRRLGAVRVQDSGHVLAVWEVRHVSGLLKPDPREVAECRWLHPEAVRTISPTLASNLRVLEMIGA